jgi:hypothetical protein
MRVGTLLRRNISITGIQAVLRGVRTVCARVRSYTQAFQFGTRGVQKQTDRAGNPINSSRRGYSPDNPALEVPVPGPCTPSGLDVP